MNPNHRQLRLVRRLALLCAVLVLVVVSLSAYMRQTKAGLGCADWPNCYGQSLRQLQHGVALGIDEQVNHATARLVHRIAAVTVLLLVIVMVYVCFGVRPVLRAEGAMALALLGLALFLAVLGRWSSGARVPAVAMGNLLGGFAMLALSVRLTLAGRPPNSTRGRFWVALAATLVIIQVALGGLVSASFSGLSCTAGWADCLQAAGSADWATFNPWREPVIAAAPQLNPSGALTQVLHRGLAFALLVPVVVLIALGRCRLKIAVVFLCALALQMAIGLALSQGSLTIALALLHNALAAALLVLLVLAF